MVVKSIRGLVPYLGMSHTALGKHLHAGKFQEEPGGGFDVEKVAAALNRNADFDHPSQAKGATPKPQVPDAPSVPKASPSHKHGSSIHLETDEGLADDPVRRAFNKAKAVRETAKAKEAEIDYKLRAGEVIEAEVAASTWAKVGSRVKDEISALPTRIVNRLPDEWRRQVNIVVMEETRRALTALSDELRSDPKAA